jgi:RimJ/RimL family protein N-acetyltransferase
VIEFTRPELVLNVPENVRTIAKSAGVHFNPECDVAVYRTLEEKLLGGVIFQGFTHASIEVHVAGFEPNWLNRDLLWVVFDYPFNQLGVSTVFSRIRESNPKALEFNLKIGFKVVHRIDGVFPDGQCIVTSLTRDNCRWLNIRPRTLQRQGV